jgi:hypothetical protein
VTAVPTRAAGLGSTSSTHNWTIGRDGLVVEIMDVATSGVWLCQQPMTDEEFQALSLPDGFIPLGIGGAVADAAYFRRSPGADVDGPVDTMDVDGHTFSFVARPGERETAFDEAMVLAVDKHHSMWFATGRTLEILDMGDGRSYIPQTTATTSMSTAGVGGRERVLAEDWSILTVTLESDLLVEVANPARVCFLADGSSFQGPVDLDLP